MRSIVKDLLLSKKFVVALLTGAGAVAAYFGFDVNPEAILAMMTPFLIYIGAQGWADGGKEKSKIEQDSAVKLRAIDQQTRIKLQEMGQETAMKLQMMSTGSTPPATNLPGPGQSGFTKVELMIAMLVFAVAVACGGLVSSCSHPGQSTLRFGQCILEEGVLSEVLGALQQDDYRDRVKQIGLSHAGGILECALVAIASQPSSGDVASIPRVQEGPPSTQTARARELLNELRAKK